MKNDVKPPTDKYLNRWIDNLNRVLGKPTYDGAPADVADFLRGL